MVLPPNNDDPRAPDVAGFLHRDASADSPSLPDNSDATKAEEQRIQEMQSSLVERIADVDDERRRSAAQMHRALETHRAETTAYVGRRWQSLLLAVGVIILLAAVIVGYLQLRVAQRLDQMVGAVGQLEQRVAEIEATRDGDAVSVGSADHEEVSAIRFQVERLGERLTGLTERVARLANRPATTNASSVLPVTSVSSAVESPASATTVGPTVGTDAVSDVETPPSASDTTKRGVGGDAASSERAVLEQPGEHTAMAEARLTDNTGGLPVSPIGVDTAVEATATRSDSADEAQGGAAPEAQSTTPTGDAPVSTMTDKHVVPGADTVDVPVDALDEEPVSDDAREYQRLARRVAAPAVRSRDVADEGEGDGSGILGPVASETAVGQEQASEPLDQATDESGSGRVRLGDRPVVLQLIGFFSRDLMDAFIERSSLPPEVYSMQETFRERPWFVLIHSHYRNRAEAREAIANLPPDLAKLDLWIRELPEDTELEVIPTGGMRE
jgi:DamX protein